MEYPYYDTYVSKDKVLKDFEDLKKFKPKFIFNDNLVKFKPKNKVVLIDDNYFKNERFHKITDFFSERARSICVFNEGKNSKSIFENYNLAKDQILIELSKKYKKITPEILKEELYNKFRECTTFKTTLVKAIFEIFKPLKVLDPSAGWGDRLIGAIAYGCEYTGVDPSETMNLIYPEITKTLATEGNYRIFKSGFEDVDLEKNYYDLVFTSPPFFDLEIYDSKRETQSISVFKSFESWKNKFLFVVVKKCYEYLKTNGNMVLYISDYRVAGKEFKYVNDLKSYIRNNIEGFRYEGNIYFIVTPGKTIRPIYVWKKIY